MVAAPVPQTLSASVSTEPVQVCPPFALRTCAPPRSGSRIWKVVPLWVVSTRTLPSWTPVPVPATRSTSSQLSSTRPLPAETSTTSREGTPSRATPSKVTCQASFGAPTAQVAPTTRLLLAFVALPPCAASTCPAMALARAASRRGVVDMVSGRLRPEVTPVTAPAASVWRMKSPPTTWRPWYVGLKRTWPAPPKSTDPRVALNCSPARRAPPCARDAVSGSTGAALWAGRCEVVVLTESRRTSAYWWYRSID
ncbi:MAG TPA: hypothetical protein VGC06_29550 [Actinomycetes bacterium]